MSRFVVCVAFRAKTRISGRSAFVGCRGDNGRIRIEKFNAFIVDVEDVAVIRV